MSSLPTAAAARTERGEEHSFGLDLARFIAVSLVLVTHCTSMFGSLAHVRGPVSVLLSAFFGVELFFVLSGFLIGRLLFRIVETAPSPRSWLIFMTRRWLRTLPLYFLWLAVIPLVLILPADPFWHLAHYATMTQNLAWPMPADHWFNESWSLAVEEWFYLLFAAVLIGAVALARSTRAIWVVIAAFLVVPAVLRLSQPAPEDFEQQIYHVVVFRLDAIAYGVALARLYQQRSRLFDHPILAGLVGAALIAAFWQQDTYGRWLLAMPQWAFMQVQLPGVSIGLSLLLAASLRLRRFAGPVAWVITTGARIRNGVYIMHLTIIASIAWECAKLGLGIAVIMPVSLVLMWVLPYLSYRFFETPFLKLRPRQSHPPAIVSGARTDREPAAATMPAASRP